MADSLLDSRLIADVLTRDAPWSESHGADGAYLGAGLLYYALTYTMRAEVAVCLGSGGGFVPRLMRQAQRDAGIADRSRTILVDGNVPEAGWGAPQWLGEESFFRVRYPDVELVLQKTSEAAESVFAAGAIRIDYLHIDADHSLEGCLDDFIRYRPFLHAGSVVTLHDTNYPGAGVNQVLDHLRARADCAVVDFAEAGTGTAIVRITSDEAPRAARRIPADSKAAVRITRKPGAPTLDPPLIQWRYLRSPAFSVRNVLAAHFVRDCPTVIEIGGWHTPIDRYLTGAHTSVLVVDPFIRETERDELNGAPCRVRHVRARFQDLRWKVLREGEYGLVILGLELEGLSEHDEAALHDLVARARTTVVEFPTSWEPSREQYARIRAGTGVEELIRARIDLDGNDFGDLTNSWPPRVERELYVLGSSSRQRRAAPPPTGAETVVEDVGENWRRVLAGDASARAEWRAFGGAWSFDKGGVRVTATGEEWVSLEWRRGLSDLGPGGGFVVEVIVSGEGEAAGVSFGPYRDFLARLSGPHPHRVEVDVDGAGGVWALRVDGRLQPRAWWNDDVGSADDLLAGPLTLKARHAVDVRFGDLGVRTREATCRLSVVLTCNRFLQRLRLALRSWCEQELPAGTLEILVVNPESPDGTAEHLAAVARAWRHVRVREVRVSADLATNKGAMINRALEACEGAWVWIADADCLFPPSAAREALRQAEAAPAHLYFLRRQHLSAAQTDALLAGRFDPVRDFDQLAGAMPIAPPQDHAPWGYTQLVPRAALAMARYREDVNHFAHTDEAFAETCRRLGFTPRALAGLVCLHLDHPFSWDGTTSFL